MKILLTLLAFCTSLFCFHLKAIKLTNNIYYVEGKKEYFTKKNKGDISNSAFIITNKSIILIDTGSSVEYAKELKKLIKKISSKPIRYIINTHHHPDHFLGNYAFKNSDIYATKHTKKEIEKNGELYIQNMVSLLGRVSYTTKIKAPNKILNKKTLVLDDYKLDVLYLDGHTKSDIVLLDKKQKVLFVSDLIFNKRALATPHANIDKWIESLEKLKTLDFDILVPGHGTSSKGHKVINENIKYLKFLDSTLKKSINEGLDSFETLELEVPKEFQDYAIFKEEYERSIINLFPKYENK